jgi:HSP20 family molecular chaperone IbpA
MLVPALFRDGFFDDWMLPALREAEDVDHKLYGKHAARVMKTDVQEKDDGYIVDIDLPGFKKDEINIGLENGYLTVSAAKGLDKDENDKQGRVIRCERYAGSMQRNFYVGKEIKHEDIKAKFEDGVLKLSIPKKDPKAVEEKKYIAIE